MAAPQIKKMMNNFTPRAQQVLALARKEADRFNHNYVGTEHLLLGLIKLAVRPGQVSSTRPGPPTSEAGRSSHLSRSSGCCRGGGDRGAQAATGPDRERWVRLTVIVAARR